MVLSTLFFYNEIKQSQAKELKVKIDDKELKMAKAIIDSMTSEFKPEEYRDEYRERLLQAIQLKIKGEEFVLPKEEKINKAVDLMDALQASLAQAKNANANRVQH